MQVRFRTRQLERAFYSGRKPTCVGPSLGRRYVQRIEMLKAAESFEQLETALAWASIRCGGTGGASIAVRLTRADAAYPDSGPASGQCHSSRMRDRLP